MVRALLIDAAMCPAGRSGGRGIDSDPSVARIARQLERLHTIIGFTAGTAGILGAIGGYFFVEDYVMCGTKEGAVIFSAIGLLVPLLCAVFLGVVATRVGERILLRRIRSRSLRLR